MIQKRRAIKLISKTRGYLKRLDEEGIKRLPLKRISKFSKSQAKATPKAKKKTRREDLITLREEVLKLREGASGGGA